LLQVSEEGLRGFLQAFSSQRKEKNLLNAIISIKKVIKGGNQSRNIAEIKSKL
jgi:hypothetical protein